MYGRAARLDLAPVGALGEPPGALGAGSAGRGPARLIDGHVTSPVRWGSLMAIVAS